ncbi:MAG: hypothetical protein ACYC2O_14060, partial [Microthrixaceae bacterium]
PADASDGDVGRAAPPMPYAEVTPDEVPYAIFSVEPVDRADPVDHAATPDPGTYEGRPSVFSVTPRAASQASGAASDERSAARPNGIPALPPGSPALPPTD